MDSRLSIIRVFACFLVVVLHTSGVYFSEYHNGWHAGNIFDSISRVSVPLFFMLAGATLLRKSEGLSIFFKKRFFRIIPPFIFWSFFYLICLQLVGKQIPSWIGAILTGSVMYHLWFFYALIGLYIFTPVLQKFYLYSTQAEKIWYIVIWFLISSLFPLLYYFINAVGCVTDLQLGPYTSLYNLQYFFGYAGFFVLGAFLYEIKLKLRYGLFLYVISTIITISLTYFTTEYYEAPCEIFYSYLSPFVITASAGIFILFLGFDSIETSRLLNSASDSTIGIYGLHALFVQIFRVEGFFDFFENKYFSILLISVLIFIICFALVSFVRMAKPFRRFI